MCLLIALASTVAATTLLFVGGILLRHGLETLFGDTSRHLTQGENEAFWSYWRNREKDPRP